MAAASPSGQSPCAAWLTEHQISALSDCVWRILEEIWPRLQSDKDASDAIFGVKHAVQYACSQFASSFNDRNPRAATSRLPIELLTACLYEADLPTRIRTSHVSRALRALALAERGLWTKYCCKSMPRSGEDLRPSLEFLETVIRRSDPLPLRLKFPHTYCGAHDPFAAGVAAIVTPHLYRLQAYSGSDNLFFKLNPEQLPMHALVSLDWIGDTFRSLDIIDIIIGQDSPQCLPNLRRLVAPVIDFRGHCFHSLQDLVCAVSDEESDYLFRYCPNLIRAEFYGWQSDAQLPRAPVPCSIQEIVLHGEALGGREPNGIDFDALRGWAGERIPQLTLLGAESLDTIVNQLLASHSEPTRLIISAPGVEPDVILSDATNPGRWHWAVSTRGFWGSPHCASDLQQLFTAVQITALKISVNMLDTLLSARIDAPHLLSLELRLAGVAHDVPSGDNYLRAPMLQHLFLDFGATNVRARADGVNNALELLAQNFRRLIVYDAELLETVTVRPPARIAVGTDCASFARFARQYVELTRP